MSYKESQTSVILFSMKKAYPNPSETLCKILASLKFKNQCPTFVTGQNKLININLTRLKISIYFWLYKTQFFALLRPVSNFLPAGGSCSSACRSLIWDPSGLHLQPRRAWKHSQALMPSGREQPEPVLPLPPGMGLRALPAVKSHL